MARWIAALALTLGLLAPSAPADAQGAAKSVQLKRILSSGKLRVGMSGSQPPLNFRSKGGEMLGLEVDLAQALANMIGVELEIVQKPFAELLATLAAGKVDVVMSGLTTTAERNARAAFVGPYFLSGKSILTRSATLAQADEAGDLDQSALKLAALEGSTSQTFVERRLPKASLVTTLDYEAAVKLLLEDQVNALVADREVVMLTALLNPKEGLATLRDPLTIEPIGMAMPAGDVLMVNYLENMMGALEASGVMSALRASWLESGDWLSQLP